MNKIFKVIFNRATGKTVVVSELTKSHGKSASQTDERASVGLFNIGAATGAAVLLGAMALAPNTFAAATGTEPDTSAVALGTGSRAGLKGVAIGNSTNATGEQATAVGQAAIASGSQSTAIGGDVRAEGWGSIAIGGDDANGTPYEYLLYNATSGRVETSTGRYQRTLANGATAIAIGVKSQATANGTTALGVLATATGVEATSLGAMSAAKGERSIALGAGSTASGNKAFAAGDGSLASANNSIAIGSNANASAVDTTALGANSTSSGINSTALGKGSTANATDTVAVGQGAQATAENATSMGSGAIASAKNSVAIGQGASASNSTVGSIALGKNANSSATGTLAIGTSSIANATYAHAYGDTTKVYAERAIAVGLASNISAGSTNATLLGSHATIGANSVRAVSVGSGNSVSSANATALGSGITIGAGLESAVVLGANSGTTGSHTIATETGATVNGVTYSGFKGVASSVGRFVSVGSTGNERKIINLAAGNVSATSTEAINGSQLYMVANELKTQMGSGSSIQYLSVNSSVADNQNNNGATGLNAIAIGPNSTVTGNNGTSIGINSRIGNAANAVAIGREANVSGDSGTAIGNSAHAVKDATAYGVLSNASAERATAIGAATLASAANATAVGNQANATSAFATSIGNKAIANISNGVALGAGSVTTRDIPTTGGYDMLTGTASTATDKTWKANAAAVSVGNATHTRQIVNVAAGSEDTDAVNVAQLKKVVESRADSTRTYTFSIENGASAQANTSGNADTWNLTTNDSLTFGASGDLNVTTDGAGKIVYGLSSTFSNKITAIETTANNANTTANNAKTVADAAKATADDAKATADTAKATANDAKATADTAKATADDAKATADTAKATADDAKATADTAKATADDAKATADDAKAIAGTGKDGKDGSTGTTGAAGQGLTGKDGLNGKDLTTKVNALRNGEAGSVVYTDADGNRLVKANDGQYYPADQVEANGEPKADARPEANPIASVVNPDGSTTAPTTMGNVKSNIGLNGKDATGADLGPIGAAAAKDAVAGADGKSGLLTKTGPELNNAATVGDLQAIAQAGLDFTGNNAAENKDVHRPLGTKLTIEGETTNANQTKADFGATAANNIHVESKGADNKLVISLTEDLKGINSVDFKPAEITNPDGSTTYAKANISSKGNTYVETDKDGVAKPDGKTASYGLNGTEMVETDADGNKSVSTTTAKGTDIKETAKDGSEKTASYKVDGTELKETAADGTEKAASYKVDGTTLEEVAADGTEKSAEYKVDGSKVTVVDPTTGETKETKMDADGTHATVKDKDGNPTKSADYTADGSTVKAIDPTTGKAKESTYGADGLSTKALDKNGNVTSETTVTPEGVNLYGKDGKDGKDAEPVASLTNKVDADGKNNPSLAFAKDGKGDDAKGTGSVTGLKDIERNLDGTAKDRTAAANAGYVDDRLAEMNDGKPFEYFDEAGNQVVRGKDGKFYDPKALEGKVYDPTTGKYYPAKADGTADTAQTPVKGKPASQVVIKAMPNEAGPVAMGNVGSGLGLEAYNGKPGADGKTVPAKYDATNADNVKAAQGAADKLYALDGDKLSNVVTAGDLQALAVAGLDFTGNNNATTVHRALGSKLTVEGEGAWNGQSSAADNLYVQADAANNKLVVKMNENLTGINSVDFKPTEITNPDGSKTYAKASMSSAGNTYVETDKDGKAVPNGKSATYGLNGSSLADGKGNVTNMTAAGTNVVDAAGNTANYGANGLTVADKDGNPAITLVNNASGPSLNFAKNADGTGTGKITGVAAGDITPDSTDVVTGAQVYALSGGNNVTINPADGSTTSTAKDKDGNIIMTTDENGNPVEKKYTLTTYNVEGQTEFVTNSVITAVHNMNEQGIKFFHTNDDKVTPVDQTGPNGIDSSASGAYATAVGYQATASGTNALAMGKGATVTGENSIAIGTGNQVLADKAGAFGDPNIIEKTATGSYAIGNDNVINSSNTFVLGNDVNNKLDANGKITGQAAGNTVENSVYLGNKSTATAGDGSATGTLKNLKQDGTQGSTTTAGSTGTVSTAKVGNMTYDGFAGAKADGVVSVGAAGNERRVQNVAAGEISATSTDAINGSQLYSVAKGVDQLDGKVNRMNRKLRSGIAAATAMTNIPQVTLPGKSALGAGVGSYDGQGALAVGYSRMSDNGRIILKLSAGASTQGKYNAGAGVAVQW